MKKTAAPQKKSNPLLVGGGAVALLAMVMWSQSDSGPAPLPKSTRKARTTTAKNEGFVTEADYEAKFPPLAIAAVDAFNPLIKKEAPVVAPPVADVSDGGIPNNLTGGTGPWYYTGWVELNGRRQALLENPTTGESEYVDQGSSWKKARIQTVDLSVVVLVGPDGKSYSVPIQEYGVVPGQSAPKSSAQPLNVPTGAIGGAGTPGGTPNGTIAVRPVAGTATMTLPDGRTVQVPLDATAGAAANGDNNGNGRRRNRRNRNNNNSGGFQNVP